MKKPEFCQVKLTMGMRDNVVVGKASEGSVVCCHDPVSVLAAAEILTKELRGSWEGAQSLLNLPLSFSIDMQSEDGEPFSWSDIEYEDRRLWPPGRQAVLHGFKAHAPYSGCFHEWEWLVFEGDPRKDEDFTLCAHGLRSIFNDNRYMRCLHSIAEEQHCTLYDLTEKDMYEMFSRMEVEEEERYSYNLADNQIFFGTPDGWVSSLAHINQEIALDHPYEWRCYYTEEWTTEMPYGYDSKCGDGGVGVVYEHPYTSEARELFFCPHCEGMDLSWGTNEECSTGGFQCTDCEVWQIKFDDKLWDQVELGQMSKEAAEKMEEEDYDNWVRAREEFDGDVLCLQCLEDRQDEERRKNQESFDFMEEQEVQ